MSKNVSKHLLTKHGRFSNIFLYLDVQLASRASWMMKLIAIEGPTGVKKCYRGKEHDLIFVVGERVWGEKVPSLSALL